MSLRGTGAKERGNPSPADMLRRVPFFKEMDRSAIDELADQCVGVRLRRGEELFAEGDPGRGMFLVLSGTVKIYRASAAGREQILAIESAGATIAELPLLDRDVYPASCAAIEDSELLLLPHDAFEDLLRRRPEVAVGALRVLGRRMRQLVTLVDELSLLEVPQRLAKYLLETSGRRGTTFSLTLSNQEIAGRLGTVREIVSRNLHRLEQQGVLRIEGRRITILDPEALRGLVEQDR